MSIRTGRVLAFLAHLPRSFPSVLLLSACILVVVWLCRPACTQAQDTPAQQAPSGLVLEVGKQIERELAGGQSHSYQLRIPANQYLRIVVVQRGVDVVVTLFGADGKGLVQVDGTNTNEVLQMVTEEAGEYRLAIRTFKKEAPLGKYVVSIEEQRIATEPERLVRKASDLKKKGKFDEALPVEQQLLAIREKTLGLEHPDVATSLNNLALLHKNKGDYATAESMYKRSLAISEKAFGPDHLDVANTLHNLALLYRDNGDYSAAELLLKRVLTIREKTAYAAPLLLADSLNFLAELYRQKADYAAAEPMYKRSLALREKLSGAGHPAVATALNNLAILYYAKGDYAMAEPMYKRALAIWEKALGVEHPSVARALNNLAELYEAKGDYATAETLYKKALAISEKSSGPDHPDVAICLNNLAALYQTKSDYAAAEPLLKRALAIKEKVLAPGHPSIANSLSNLADLYYVKSDYASAEPLLKQALALLEKAWGPEHPDIARSLNNLANLYKAKGDYAAAVPLFNRVLMIGEGNMRRNLSGSERQQQAYLTTFAKSFNAAIALHPQSAPRDPQARQLALTALLRFKGRSLDESTDTLNRLRSRADKATRTLLDQLFSARSQSATLTLRGPDERPLETYRSRLEQLGQEIETLEADLSRRSLEFRTTTLPVAPEAVAAAIPADAALVEFVQYRPVEAKTAKQLAPHYVVYVLTAQGEPRWAELGEAAVIDQQVGALRLALRNPKRGDYKRIARTMDKQVMEPVRKLVDGKTQLLLSPDGMLNLLPFAALVDESGKYLMERYKLAYLSSGRDLLRLQIKQESKAVAVVLANPAFDGRPAADALAQRDIKPVYGGSQSSTLSLDFANANFKSLPGTAGEAQALKQLLPEATVLTHEQATEAALKKVDRPRLLHIATHGFFLPDLNLNAGGVRNGEAASSARLENPLLRSGLALAGANLHKGGDDDGILTALEAAGLDLWGTKLVVLSACDTGVGEVKNGEGVYGLRRAFVLAGSESQVMSLWSVSDQGTKELMVEYYKRLIKGEGRGEALRQVQLQMLKHPNRHHPYYWASFIQSGEWANLDGNR